MEEKDKIREVVSASYAAAVKNPSTCGCCGGGKQKGTVVKYAGYKEAELAALPSGAVENSFGCGNPLAYSQVKEGDVVLDLGSGAGIDILLAARIVGPTGRAIGIDMTDEMLSKARENIAASGLTNVEVRKGLIEKLPVDSASVDWVISNCVINLSPEKNKVFAEIARVLKPGGKFLISDIVVTDLPDWARKSEMLYSSCVAGAISEVEYLKGLRDAGLADVEVKGRLVYEASQIAEFAKSEVIPGKEEALGCCSSQAKSALNISSCGGTVDTKELISKIAQSMTGKIWSAKFYGIKP